MKKVLLAAILASSIALSGCSTVYTPGTRDLPLGGVYMLADNVAKLTASSVVGFRNYNGYTVASIKIDGVSYPLSERTTTFVLTAGRHEVEFSYSVLPTRNPFLHDMARPLPPRTYCFQTLPGGLYELVSHYSSAGLIHRILTPEHENVLKPLEADTH
jgi:hypothetical protein